MCFAVVFLSQPLFETPTTNTITSGAGASTTEATQVSQANVTPSPTSTRTPTPSPSPSPTWTATSTLLPTATSTLVVNFTLTPSRTPTPRRTATSIATETPAGNVVPVSTGGGGTSSGGSTGVGPRPTPTATSRYPFRIQEPLEYKTTNHFFVILARVTQGGVPVPGYRLVGSHSVGNTWESIASCAHWCKASGPGSFVDDDGNTITTWPIQEGNVVFEAPTYDTGVWTVVLVGPSGEQASEYFQIELDKSERKWYFYLFER